MYNLDKAYSKKFFAQRKSLSWRVSIICDAIINVLKPKSVIDVGCGNGDLVQGFIDKGLVAFGIEGTENVFNAPATGNIIIRDLRKENVLSDFRQFDLAICFEVAEHIEPEYTDIFLDNLCSLSDRILFSAAGPGQGGIHHHNCQPKAYWVGKFYARGYLRYCEKQIELENKWHPWRNKKGIKAYYQNLIYFEKAGATLGISDRLNRT